MQKIDHERCEAELAGLVLLMQKKDQFIGVDQSTVVIKKFEIPCRSISYRYGQSFDSPPDCELNAVYLDTSTNFMYMLINHVQYVSEMPVNPNRQYCSNWQLLEAIDRGNQCLAISDSSTAVVMSPLKKSFPFIVSFDRSCASGYKIRTESGSVSLGSVCPVPMPGRMAVH